MPTQLPARRAATARAGADGGGGHGAGGAAPYERAETRLTSRNGERDWDTRVGTRSSGEREVIGVDVGPAEDLEFWLGFLRQLAGRGLKGVRLVTSDSHLGLTVS